MGLPRRRSRVDKNKIAERRNRRIRFAQERRLARQQKKAA